MEWLEVTVKTISSAIDLLGAKLTAIGYDSFIIDDSEDFSEFLKDNTQYWDYVDEALAEKMQNISQIRLYIEQDSRAPERIAQLKSELAAFRAQNPDTDLGSLEVTLQNLKEEDWEESWNLEALHPALDRPGCRVRLRALEQTISGGERVIDLGSGSGILSIAALLLGAAEATGVDIDPKAEDIARENAALNGLTTPKFTAVTGNVIGDRAMMERLCQGGYDVVLANIVADVIIPLSAVVPHFLRPGAVFICSGILNTRLPEVEAALEAAGLTITQREMQEDWCRLSAKRSDRNL